MANRYALVSHNIVNKTKEIGIRKVMGGSTRQMITLIFTYTLKWTFIASVVGIPLLYLFLRKWLNDYTIRIPLFWWIFVVSLLIILFFSRPSSHSARPGEQPEEIRWKLSGMSNLKYDLIPLICRIGIKMSISALE